MISFEPLWETMKKRDISQFKLDSRDTGTTALFHHGECACRSAGQGHGQADQRTGRGRAAQLMGVSLGFPKGVRVASGDLKMQHILKHLTEPTGERQHPFGTRLCLQSLVCYTLVPADAEKGLREVPASTCSATCSVAEGCADGHGS